MCMCMCICGLAEACAAVTTCAGLALIPLMPYIDHPVEHVIDVGFEKAWPKEGPPPWVAVMDTIDKPKKE